MRAFDVFNHHCAIRKLFRSNSTLCPAISHQDIPHTTEDVDEQPDISMEEYWKGMEDKSEVVDKKKVKEKRDLSDVVQRIRELAVVIVKEAHRLNQEYADDQ